MSLFILFEEDQNKAITPFQYHSVPQNRWLSGSEVVPWPCAEKGWILLHAIIFSGKSYKYKLLFKKKREREKGNNWSCLKWNCHISIYVDKTVQLDRGWIFGSSTIKYLGSFCFREEVTIFWRKNVGLCIYCNAEQACNPWSLPERHIQVLTWNTRLFLFSPSF